MTGSERKACEACGKAFNCMGYGCWCAQVGITERQMDWIAARFQDCLCPDCLQHIHDGTLRPDPDEFHRGCH